MFKKLIEYLKEALRNMTAYKDVNDTIKQEDIYTVSEAMSTAIDKWRNMYMDEAEWLDDDKGIYSMNIASTICSELAMYVLNEMQSHIVVPGQLEDSKEHDNSKDNVDIYTNRATFLDDLYHKHLLDKLDDVLEKAMALGGVIIKPYMSNNTIYFDFCYQGEFYPIAFDDDGNIVDIAFLDQFIVDSKKYSKVERQVFKNNTVAVTNKCYMTKYNPNSDTNELGTEIPLTQIEKWANVEPETTIENVEKPLFGYYKVPLANNVDLKSPLGVSVFSKATKVIERADKQYSRLDWEYEGGQIAIDVDPTAIVNSDTYFGTTLKQDELRNRVYRKIDLGTDETYNAFTPALRDTSYMAGLNRYLMRVEDIVCLARGTLSDVQSDARTATEIKTLKQRTFSTVAHHQESLQKALENAIYSANVLVELYTEELQAPQGDYVTNTEWSDSILVDTYAELEQKLTLVDKNIMSKTEVRMWYTGEDEATAQAAIDKITEDNQANMMNDLFSSIPGATLEKDENEEPEDNTEDEEE